jgi:CHAT domain-containing protein
MGLDLPGTRAELAKLKALLPATQLLEGADATRAALLERATAADVLHIASHSALDRQNVNGTYIQLSGEKLTLGDVYRLRLAPGSLVVLSSCESGLGEDNPGREFASLAAAFRMAGASAVVSTLWKVEDSVGPELFAEFYRQLQNGVGRARALQLAKVACLRKAGFEHPGDWAAYTLLGD